MTEQFKTTTFESVKPKKHGKQKNTITNNELDGIPAAIVEKSLPKSMDTHVDPRTKRVIPAAEYEVKKRWDEHVSLSKTPTLEMPQLLQSFKEENYAFLRSDVNKWNVFLVLMTQMMDRHLLDTETFMELATKKR